MISLTQYRVSVGLFNVFLKAKEFSHCVNGQLWSTLLFMFYLEAIYLPVLQRQVRLWQMNYFAGLWFTQMWLYRFYFPLLIRLANDVEINPGPIFSMESSETVQSNSMSSEINQTCDSPSMLVLALRLAQLGLRPLDVGGAGDCFFRAVSHQLYGTATYHLQVRALGIEHLRYHPESFIESNIEYSWLEYLSNMSRQGTWCDNLIIQAVANALNCTIYIIESAENFAESNVINPVNMQGRPRTIYIGHIDEIHYVSTAPIEHEELNVLQRQSSEIHEEITLLNDGNQACITQIVSPVNQKSLDTYVTNDALEKRKAFMRQYMKDKRANRQFRVSENKKKQQKRRENLEKSRECQRQASKAYKKANPVKVKQLCKQAKTKRRVRNLEKVKECQRQDFLKHKEANPEKVKQMDKQAKTKRRKCNLEKVKECQRQDFLKYKEANPEKVKEINKQTKTKRRECNLEKVKEYQRLDFLK